jgi:hypothetical protein
MTQEDSIAVYFAAADCLRRWGDSDGHKGADVIAELRELLGAAAEVARAIPQPTADAQVCVRH